jgi:hypothetical protein
MMAAMPDAERYELRLEIVRSDPRFAEARATTARPND